MIALVAIASAVVGFGYSTWAVNNGLEVPISGATLALSTALIAVILIGLAVPIWKYKKNLVKAATPNRLLPVN